MRDTTQDLVNELSKAAEEERRCITGEGREENQALSYLARRGELLHVGRGLYAQPSVWKDLKYVERAQRIVRSLASKHPNWIFCGPSAAVIYGLEVPHGELDVAHIAVTSRIRSDQSEDIVRHPLANRKVEIVDGVQVVELERTVYDLLTTLDFINGLPIADSALRVGGLSREQLQTRLRSYGEVEGLRQALVTVGWANELADNGGESVARAIMIEQGFMVPELQKAIPNLIEGGVFYADFWWELEDGTCIAGELDGMDKYVDPEMTGGRSLAQVMADERRRESRIGMRGIKVVRFSFAEALNREMLTKLLTTSGVPRGASRPKGFSTRESW